MAPHVNSNQEEPEMTTNAGDKYDEGNVDLIPSGAFKGRLWTHLKAATLQNILNAVDQGLVVLDARRVAAVRKALERKRCAEAGGEG